MAKKARSSSKGGGIFPQNVGDDPAKRLNPPGLGGVGPNITAKYGKEKHGLVDLSGTEKAKRFTP